MNFAKFLRTTFLYNASGRLLLDVSNDITHFIVCGNQVLSKEACLLRFLTQHNVSAGHDCAYLHQFNTNKSSPRFWLFQCNYLPNYINKSNISCSLAKETNQSDKSRRHCMGDVLYKWDVTFFLGFCLVSKT